MTSIDWKSEALKFAKANNTCGHMVVQLVEQAMKHGATLMVIKTTEKLKGVCSDLDKRHRESAPDVIQTKLIDVDLS